MANLLVEEPDALMYARPDLWEHWVVTPRATRPDEHVGNCRGVSPALTPLQLRGLGSPLRLVQPPRVRDQIGGYVLEI
jgi:hypothetical protein